jgi:DNA-binding LytR/AlgR family response regulator
MIQKHYYLSQSSESNITAVIKHPICQLQSISNLNELINIENKQFPQLIFVDIRKTDIKFSNFLKDEYYAYYVIIDSNNENAQNCFRMARDINIRDYITTPITSSKIQDCIVRYNQYMALRKASNETNLIIKEKGLHFNIETRSIKLLEGYGSYTRIHTADKVYIVSKTIKKLFELLPNQFIRTHRSFAVHQKQVRSLRGNSLLLHNGEYVKVSKAGRQIILNHLNKAG